MAEAGNCSGVMLANAYRIGAYLCLCSVLLLLVRLLLLAF